VDVEIRASQPPPALPIYDQPPCPQDGYLWTPGYWHWTGSDYYWVPGTWVQPPQVGVLWTPGYWGFVGGMYGWHVGYWGPTVGFYGGVNYGFGYVGVGFAGGRWAGNSFAYNAAVVNVNTTVIHNTYSQTVVNNVTVNKVSYNGGAGGVAATPTAQERAAAAQPHIPPTQLQQQHVQQAIHNPALAASANGGHPSIAATPRPAAFNAPGVVGARGASSPPPRAGGSPATGQPNSPNNQHNGNGQGQNAPGRPGTTNAPGAPAVPPQNSGSNGAGHPQNVPPGQSNAPKAPPPKKPPPKPEGEHDHNNR
jgi:hypothetical protein